MTPTARFDRLDRFIAEGRIIRGSWGDGKERACLLLALAPEVGSGNIAACPASVLPPWLAELTPPIDDNVAAADWQEIVATYARVVRRGSERLDADGWHRVLARFLAAILGDLPGEHPAAVAALWSRALAGDEPTEQEWQEAAMAAAQERAARASAAALAAAEAAADAAWAAEDAAATWSRSARHLFAAIEAEVAA